MTVEELIEKLKQFDQSLPVVTPGFDESGIEDIGEPRQVEVGEYISTSFTSEVRFTDLVYYRGREYVSRWRAVMIDFLQ